MAIAGRVRAPVKQTCLRATGELQLSLGIGCDPPGLGSRPVVLPVAPDGRRNGLLGPRTVEPDDDRRFGQREVSVHRHWSGLWLSGQALGLRGVTMSPAIRAF